MPILDSVALKNKLQEFIPKEFYSPKYAPLDIVPSGRALAAGARIFGDVYERLPRGLKDIAEGLNYAPPLAIGGKLASAGKFIGENADTLATVPAAIKLSRKPWKALAKAKEIEKLKSSLMGILTRSKIESDYYGSHLMKDYLIYPEGAYNPKTNLSLAVLPESGKSSITVRTNQSFDPTETNFREPWFDYAYLQGDKGRNVASTVRALRSLAALNPEMKQVESHRVTGAHDHIFRGNTERLLGKLSEYDKLKEASSFNRILNSWINLKPKGFYGTDELLEINPKKNLVEGSRSQNRYQFSTDYPYGITDILKHIRGEKLIQPIPRTKGDIAKLRDELIKKYNLTPEMEERLSFLELNAPEKFSRRGPYRDPMDMVDLRLIPAYSETMGTFSGLNQYETERLIGALENRFSLSRDGSIRHIITRLNRGDDSRDLYNSFVLGASPMGEAIE